MKKIALYIAGLATGIAAILGIATVLANPPYFTRCATSGCPLVTVSTSTQAYFTGGTGTTTLTYDAFIPNSNGAPTSLTGNDTALFMVQVTASGTTPILKARVEHSQDNIDWYPENTPLNSLATTTLLAGNFSDNQFFFATSTINGDFGGSGNASTTVIAITPRQHASLVITTPTRYTRVKMYAPSNSGNFFLFGEIVGKKQQ